MKKEEAMAAAFVARQGENPFADQLLCTALDVAEHMLRCGGDVHRAEDTVAVMPLPEAEVDKGFFYRNFARALEGKEALTVAPEQTLRVMAVIDLAFRSAEQNQVIACRV